MCKLSLVTFSKEFGFFLTCGSCMNWRKKGKLQVAWYYSWKIAKYIEVRRCHLQMLCPHTNLLLIRPNWMSPLFCCQTKLNSLTGADFSQDCPEVLSLQPCKWNTSLETQRFFWFVFYQNNTGNISKKKAENIFCPLVKNANWNGSSMIFTLREVFKSVLCGDFLLIGLIITMKSFEFKVLCA